LLVGAGVGPMHSLIGALQNAREAVSGLANLAKSSAVRNATASAVASLTGDESTRAVKPFNPDEPEAVATDNVLRVQRRARRLVRY